MTVGIMVCRECGSDYDTIEDERATPQQALRQQCPDCGHEDIVGIINYPDGSYTAIAVALPDDECRRSGCDQDGVYRLQTVGEPVTGVCYDHQLSMYKSTLELVT